MVSGFVDGLFLYIAPEEGRQGMAEFIAALQLGDEVNPNAEDTPNTFTNNNSRLVLRSQEDCPERYYANPFAPGAHSDAGMDIGDAFVLHFYDLAAKKKHVLYTFQKIE